MNATTKSRRIETKQQRSVRIAGSQILTYFRHGDWQHDGRMTPAMAADRVAFLRATGFDGPIQICDYLGETIETV